MQVVLAEETITVENKKKETDELLERVGQESIVAEEQAEMAPISPSCLSLLSLPPTSPPRLPHISPTSPRRRSPRWRRRR